MSALDLHEESRHLMNSMLTPKASRYTSKSIVSKLGEEIEENCHGGGPDEWRLVFEFEYAAQDKYVDLVGCYLDELIGHSDEFQV
jgi:hypothetical protein